MFRRRRGLYEPLGPTMFLLMLGGIAATVGVVAMFWRARSDRF